MNLLKLFRMLSLARVLVNALAETKELLARLAKDDYEGAAAYLLAHPALQDDLARLPAEALAAAPVLLPLLLKALDRVLPEEQILAALN